MARVGSTYKVNVVVQFDRIGKYAHTNPDWTQTLRFRITKGLEPLPKNALEDIGEANMGDGKTLADFVAWGRKKFPSRHTMLVIWDHGQGWRLFLESLGKRQRFSARARAVETKDTADSLRAAAVQVRNGNGVAAPTGETAPFRSAPGDAYRSASNDETDNDVLYNREIEDALKSTLNGEKLDIIGFDACLMAMVETNYALRDVAGYLIGSEELEPGPGWKYDDVLAAIIANPGQDPRTLATSIVDSYRRTYSAPTWDDQGGRETTLSSYNLSGAGQLAQAISALSDTLITTIDAEVQNIITARQATNEYAPGYGFHHVDISQFLTELNKKTANATLRNQIAALQTLLATGMTVNYAGPDRQGPWGSKGMSIYFPANEHDHLTDAYSEGGYEKDNQLYPVEFVQNERWADFLHAFWSRVP